MPSPSSAELTRPAEPQESLRVAVIGLGTLGRSWAQAFAAAGFDVAVHDSDAAQRPRLEELAAEASGGEAWAISWSDSVEAAVADATYVQEAGPEDLTLKRELLARIAAATPGAVIGSSSSAIPISRSAEGVAEPQRCLVAHPANPAHLMPIVELVPGPATAAAAVETAREVMLAAGMHPVVCRREVPGFVMNRLQIALFREALELARTGVASPADIDACVTEGLALRWAFIGPLALEGLQSPSLEERFKRYAGYYETMFEAVGGPRGPLEEADREVLREGFRQALDGRDHAELTAYRDTMLSRLVALKREAAAEAGAAGEGV